MYIKYRAVWNALAEEGVVEPGGGAECWRIYDEWVMCGCPADIMGFIRGQANKMAAKLPPYEHGRP